MALTIYALLVLFVITLSLLVFGRVFKDYTFAILGGLGVFLLGVSVLLDPVVGLSNLLNMLFGFLLFAVGAYTWVTAGLELLRVYE